jgi:hypothetical protein
MFRTLFTAILATWIASATASTNPPAAPAAVTPTGATAKATRMKLQPGTEPVKVNTVHSVNTVRNGQSGLGVTAAAGEADTDESGWHPYGTLLATLALMGVIAVRRHKAERS